MKIDDAGLTLVELLVGLTITGIVMTSIVKMFVSMSTAYRTENEVADLQQSVRAVITLMIQEIRMTGFSSLSENSFGITEADTQKVSFTIDWDNDGLVTASHSGNDHVPQESDIISYVYDQEKMSLQRKTADGTASVSTQSLLGGLDDAMNITGLRFRYYDHENEETSILHDIRSIGLEITAQTPAGRKGMVTRAYRTRIKCRNLGL